MNPSGNLKLSKTNFYLEKSVAETFQLTQYRDVTIRKAQRRLLISIT